MRRNGRLFIILGFGLATIAVALAVWMLSGGANQAQPVQQAPPPVKIIVAAVDVPPHTILRDTMLTEQTIDRDQLKGNEALTRAEVIGMAPKTAMIKGQRILKSDLEVSVLSNDIDRGKRALVVPIDKITAQANAVRDQDFVDVVLSIKVNLLYVLPSRPLELDTSTAGDKERAVLPANAPNDAAPYAYPGEAGSRFKVQGVDSKGDPLAKVVIQDVKVLRVVGAPPPPAPAAGAAPTPTPAVAAPAVPDLVVLELTDEQAELMKFAMDNGAAYTFAVRAKDDHDRANTNGITFDLLVTNYQLPIPKSVRLPGERQP